MHEHGRGARVNWGNVLKQNRLIKYASGLLALALASTAVLATEPDYWQDVTVQPLSAALGPPANYRSVTLDRLSLDRDMTSQGGAGISLLLPRPDHGYARFVLSDSGVMPAALAARYPAIRSYRGVDAQGNHARVDISPLGVNAMVFAREGIWMVRPVAFGSGSDYIVFRRRDVSGGSALKCETPPNATDAAALRPMGSTSQPTSTGVVRRSYRAAVAANHQWVQAYTGNASNPTVAEGLAGVVAAVNRVDEVYENDFAIHMTLVADNDQLIFPLAVNDGSNDPFGDSGTNNGNGLGQFTNRIDTIIGSGNYDIGHVFTTGSGGVAYLGVVCDNNYKGAGTTGLTNGALLSTDVFYIDYVAHEMGHQFGGNHTFNGSNGSCGGGNRHGGTAYEPGSGSTIMAYAGICGPDNNLQSHSDPYFHAASLDEIGTYTSASTGSTCGTETVNHALPVLAPLNDYTVPAATPFELVGAASSAAPGADLSFGWEEYDLGSPNNNLENDPGSGAIIRSFNPTGPVRYVPRLAELFAGTHPFGEILPTTSRSVNFVETVRDNIAGGGTSQSARNQITVTSAAGPFLVTSPDSSSVWLYADGAGQATVLWNVADTDLPPVACPLVDIDLTTTADFDSVTPLASSVANSGSALIDVPNVQTGTARVRVKCTNNIFFSISPADFSIVGSDMIFADDFELTP